jgi:hypothetical protein
MRPFPKYSVFLAVGVGMLMAGAVTSAGYAYTSPGDLYPWVGPNIQVKYVGDDQSGNAEWEIQGAAFGPVAPGDNKYPIVITVQGQWCAGGACKTTDTRPFVGAVGPGAGSARFAETLLAVPVMGNGCPAACKSHKIYAAQEIYPGGKHIPPHWCWGGKCGYIGYLPRSIIIPRFCATSIIAEDRTRFQESSVSNRVSLAPHGNQCNPSLANAEPPPSGRDQELLYPADFRLNCSDGDQYCPGHD